MPSKSKAPAKAPAKKAPVKRAPVKKAPVFEAPSDDLPTVVVEGHSKAGRDKEFTIEFVDGEAIVKSSGEVRLTRDGCLRAAKEFSRAAQAL